MILCQDSLPVFGHTNIARFVTEFVMLIFPEPGAEGNYF